MTMTLLLGGKMGLVVSVLDLGVQAIRGLMCVNITRVEKTSTSAQARSWPSLQAKPPLGTLHR